MLVESAITALRAPGPAYALRRRSRPQLIAVSDRRIRRPVIVLGAGRSGTSIVAELLAEHPELAYWGEPRPVWMHGHAYRRDHALGARDASPRIARYIDRRFGEFLARSGRARFLEKTPSNCLRIPFIHAIFPDCKIVNVIRDGRSVIRSTVEIRGKKPNPGSFRTRLQETPLCEWPAYVPMFFDTIWRTNVLGRPARFWGARPEGWERWRDLPPHLVTARQWQALVEASLRDGRALPAANYREVRFEDLLRDPAALVAEVMDFAELRPAREVFDATRTHFDRNVVRPWKQTLSPEQEAEALAVMEPLRARLGYGDLPASAPPRRPAQPASRPQRGPAVWGAPATLAAR